jgi:hypothetical protein
MGKQALGFQVTHTWCRECAPEGVRDFCAPLREGDDYGVPYACDVCDARLVPCNHKWGAWNRWYSGGSFRVCEKDGCGETERSDREIPAGAGAMR